MNSLETGDWACFQIEAEVDIFGVERIVAAHNKLRQEKKELEKRLKEVERQLEDVVQ